MPQMINDVFLRAPKTQKTKTQTEIQIEPRFAPIQPAEFIVDEFPQWSGLELFLHTAVLFLSIGIVMLSVLLIWHIYFS